MIDNALENLRSEEVDDSILHASEGDCSDEEDDEDKVGEQSCNLILIFCVIWKVLVK